MQNLLNYKYVVGYGIGQYYDHVKSQIPEELNIDYLCDSRYQEIGEIYDNIPVISPEKLKDLNDVFVIVFSGNPRTYQSICAMLKNMGKKYIHINEMIQTEITLSGKKLKESGKCIYTDDKGNIVRFHEDIEDTIRISFTGSNNEVVIGKGVSVGSLQINCGKNSFCSIGDKTGIEGATIFATDGHVIIGKDCLFSYQVTIRNHDSHHIFDKKTGKRINYSGNIIVGNHVWIGYGVTLLGNAEIGDNSVVGTMSVTSSKFPKEVIIAGNPAKIIRGDVCWSKDNTEFYDRDNLEECLAKEAYLYFE